MAARILPDPPQIKEGLICISLDGPLDLTTVPRLRNRLLGFGKKKETKEMSIAMAKVSQLDTAGVAMLVELWRCLARRGGKLRLTGLNEKAKRLLRLAGVEQILKIGDDAE